MSTASMSAADLITAKNMLAIGGPSSMYSFLESKGFQYATLAHSVIIGESAFAKVSLEYMKQAAAEAGKPMSAADINNVMNSMAKGYLDALTTNLDSTTGQVTSDISYSEAWAFHTQALNANGYDANSWTLNAVLATLTESGRINYWQNALSAAGHTAAENILAGNTVHLMAMQTEIGTTENKALAQSWLDKVYSIDGIRAGAEGTWNSTVKYLAELMANAMSTVSPLVLDLNGDGIQTTGLEKAVYFDHNGDGFAERTGWVNKNDGLLVWDRNNNGSVDNGGELFGNNTKLSNGSNATNGFLALQELDENHDGVINSYDSAYATLKVWKETSGNGLVDGGELLSLTAAGVHSINTQYTEVSTFDASGNQVRQVGSYVATNGSTHAMNDIWFKADQAQTIDLHPVTLTAEALAAADMPGMGTVEAFRQAISKDSSGYYTVQLAAFYSVVTFEEKHQILEEMLFHWSGADQYTVNSRGGYIDDGRKLYALESFLGIKFVQSSGTNGGTSYPGPNSAAALMKTFSAVENFYFAKLMIDGPLNGLLSKIQLSFTNGEVSFNLSAFLGDLQSQYLAKGDSADEFMNNLSSILANGGAAWPKLIDAIQAAGSLTGSSFQIALAHFGQSLTDAEGGELFGTSANERLTGQGGNDYIYGGSGSDRIEGGGGNDFLSGDEGSDTYVFNLGWGKDTVRNYDADINKTDTIQFGIGISPDDIVLSVEGVANSLVITNTKTSDQITVYAYYFDTSNTYPYRIEKITFSDGTTWNSLHIREILLAGTPENDSLKGFETDDVLIGGAGNDELNGGAGSDTYKFETEWGQDVIRSYDTTPQKYDVIELGSRISSGEIKVEQSGNSLIITRINSTDKITVLDMFSYSHTRTIDAIRFADGTTWNIDKIQALIQQASDGPDQIYGGSGSDLLDGKMGNDKIYGRGGNDTLIGGAGNDTLDGGDGSDIYFFDVDWGQDYIPTYDASVGKVDVIQFGQGVTASDITLSRDNGTLTISRVGSTDTIKLPGMFMYSSIYTIDKIQFADGTNWNVDKIKDLLLQPTSGADQLYGDGRDDVIYGMAGNDYLYGLSGNDVLIGGGGNDYLDGGSGSDIYRFDIGWGQDTLSSYDATAGKIDAIELGVGTNPSDIALIRDGNNIDLIRSGSSDKIHISNMFTYSNTYTIDEIRFQNGTVWNIDKINGVLAGATDRDDTVYGSQQDNILNGLAGNDKLYGKVGNDILIGGLGNDLLDGGDGSDTYRFDVGWGQDTINTYDSSAGKFDIIEFGEGITKNDILLSQSSNALIISRTNSTDKITVSSMYTYAPLYTVDQIKFYDGSTWGVGQIRQMLMQATGGNDTLYGDSNSNLIDGLTGNDALFGAGGNDILIGGTGNDTLDGGAGSDIYHFDRGWGQDSINAYDSSSGKIDVIEFGVGITVDDIRLSQSSNTLTISATTSTDKITLSNMYTYGSLYTIDKIRFQDGTTWGIPEIREKLLQSSDGVDTLYGDELNNLINGKGGNDYLYGRGGNDVLTGGAGNDRLDGGDGSDIYHFDLGWGQDTIDTYDASSGKIDVMEFAAAITPDNINLVRLNKDDVKIEMKGTADSILLGGMYRWTNTQTVDEIKFANGNVWSKATIESFLLTASEGDDTIYGFAGNDTLTGNAGNDKLYGLAGNDTLIGGPGNDYLDGGQGSDTFKFEKGWGKDTISSNDTSAGKWDVVVFGKNISPSDIAVSHVEGTTVLTMVNTGYSITFQTAKNVFGTYAVEEIRFESGVLWDAHTL